MTVQQQHQHQHQQQAPYLLLHIDACSLVQWMSAVILGGKTEADVLSLDILVDIAVVESDGVRALFFVEGRDTSLVVRGRHMLYNSR